MDGRELDAALLALAKRQHGIVGRAQAEQLGATKAQLEHRRSDRGWERVLPGVFAMPWASVGFHSRAWAAVIWSGDGAHLSHRAAAHLWGLAQAPFLIDIRAPQNLGRPSRWLRPHRAEELVAGGQREGLPVTSVARTLVDLAAREEDVESLAEEALRMKLVSVAELEATFEVIAERGRPGIAAFRAYLARRIPGSERVESVLEHRILRLFTDAGLPPAVAQHRIALGDGKVIRVDFAWPEQRVVVEGDSHQFHSKRRDWERDLHRHNALLIAGWRSLRVTWDDVRKNRERTIAQLRRLIPTNPSRICLP